ncbi:hypothetical protein G5714_000946 [Onychostoma macrolepis]|uniref:Uncharacterized protein n=1 Tax=Onychostoma macrolepis TaxID=369639 RepID=A0A7J6DIQ1_9TELE|nr:hypothetical protein G5714_000946 [Onychostoma macrolepis]
MHAMDLENIMKRCSWSSTGLGLPFALCDNPTDFYKVCFDSDDDYSFHHLDIGIILIEHEGDVLSSSLRLNPASLKIIIEGDFVMDSIEDLSKAVHSVWTYALHLNYPKSMKNTFQIIQQALFRIDTTSVGRSWQKNKLICSLCHMQAQMKELQGAFEGAVELIPAESSSKDIAELKDMFQKFLVDQKVKQDRQEQENARQETRWRSLQHQFRLLQGEVGSTCNVVLTRAKFRSSQEVNEGNPLKCLPFYDCEIPTHPVKPVKSKVEKRLDKFQGTVVEVTDGEDSGKFNLEWQIPTDV